jgi:hypothetical protein
MTRRYAAGTEVSPEKSRAEIESILSRYGGHIAWPAEPTACWQWTGHICQEGYGKAGGAYAHRLFYLALRGPIPDGSVLDHLCRNRSCVNPAHLEPVSAGENVLRGLGRTVVAFHNATCTKGHPLSGPNLYLSPKGQRQCRVCRRAREARRGPRKAAK